MSIKILIDMNLSPEWKSVFISAGWMATHWSDEGDPRAPDRVIMDSMLLTKVLFGAVTLGTISCVPSQEPSLR